MTLGDVNVAVGRVGGDVVRLAQRVRRISLHARFAERHQHLALWAELDDNVPLLVLARILLQLVGARYARVSHPHVALALDMDAVRPYEHAAAKAPDLPS